jgi:predicted MPP superfamily phosphohydrolase
MKKWIGAVASLSAGFSGILYAYARCIEPERIVVRPVALRLPHLTPAFNGYRIVQISDTHYDTWMTGERLNRIMDQVNALNPDMIVMTGDFVSRKSRYEVDDLVSSFCRLRARDGVYAVLGNHDYRANVQNVREIIRLSGMMELSNKVHPIRRGDEVLYICGLDDVGAQESRLDLVLQQLPPDGAAILLVHEPDFADIAAAPGRFDLQLSGHAHGAQINIPFLRHVVLPPFAHRYYRGLYYSKAMALYVNPGLGMVGLPLRFRARPEITAFTLFYSR